jgi:hypothetical protein
MAAAGRLRRAARFASLVITFLAIKSPLGRCLIDATTRLGQPQHATVPEFDIDGTAATCMRS